MGARPVQWLLRCPPHPALAPAELDARFGFAGGGGDASPWNSIGSANTAEGQEEETIARCRKPNIMDTKTC